MSWCWACWLQDLCDVVNIDPSNWSESLRGLVVVLIGGTTFSLLEPPVDSYAGKYRNEDALAGSWVSVPELNLLGGFREIAADFSWIAVYHAWQKRDVETLRQELAWATALNPDSTMFWLDGARMLGFDVAAWRREESVDVATHKLINCEQLDLAVSFLDLAQAMHPDRADYPVEQAVLHLRLANDARAAERALIRAQKCSDAPPYVARVRAELLVRMGRDREALEVLLHAWATLPPQDPRAMLEVIETRIREIRRRLGKSE